MNSTRQDNIERDVRYRLDLQAAIIELLPDALIVVDGAGSIILANQQTELMFGYHRSELIGQPVEMLLLPTQREVHAGHRLRFSAEPRTRMMGIGLRLRGQRKNGIEVPIEIMLAPVVLVQDTGTIAVIRRNERAEREAERLALATF